MLNLSKAIIFSASCPGTMGVCSWILSQVTPYPEHISVLFEKEAELGCKLWLAESFDNSTGWYLDSAMGSSWETGEVNKLKKLAVNLSDFPGSPFAKKVVTTCKGKQNKMVEMSWNENLKKWTSNETQTWDSYVSL